MCALKDNKPGQKKRLSHPALAITPCDQVSWQETGAYLVTQKAVMRCKGKVTSQKAGARSLGCAEGSTPKCRWTRMFPVSITHLLAVNKGIKAESSSFGVIGIPYIWQIVAFRGKTRAANNPHSRVVLLLRFQPSSRFLQQQQQQQQGSAVRRDSRCVSLHKATLKFSQRPLASMCLAGRLELPTVFTNTPRSTSPTSQHICLLQDSLLGGNY